MKIEKIICDCCGEEIPKVKRKMYLELKENIIAWEN